MQNTYELGNFWTSLTVHLNLYNNLLLSLFLLLVELFIFRVRYSATVN